MMSTATAYGGETSIRNRDTVPLYCECCPNDPKLMAILEGGVLTIKGRRSGRRHMATLKLVAHPLAPGLAVELREP